ncbi:PKD domain-containing protein, partial [Brevibacillus laterosporus]|uniref:PKD domain-containing protein n=1 Tax=Brevibacillus laterosporus TaxID=1465 RepID=UPI000839D1ED
MPNAHPWLDVMLTEKHLLEGLADLCIANGWRKEAEFHKVVYASRLTKPTIVRFFLPLARPYVDIPKLAYPDDFYVYLDGELMPSTYYSVMEKADGGLRIEFEPGVQGQAAIYYSEIEGSDEFEFYVAKHYIVRNISGNLFGMAVLGKVKEQIYTTGERVPFAVYHPSADWGTQLMPHDTGIFSWAIKKVEEEDLYERHTLYFYQLDKFILGGNMIVGWQDPKEFQRVALDVEVQAAMWGLQAKSQALQYKVTEQYPQFYQSPIVTSRTRIPQLESIGDIHGLHVKYTNWWSDSKVFVKGFVDGKSLMFIITSDTAPVWNSNAVPAIPLYMGDFDVEGETEEVLKRELVFELDQATRKKMTIVSNNPMNSKGSKVKVWLSGDVNGDEGELVKVSVEGVEVGVFHTSGYQKPVDKKVDAEYLGEFDVFGIDAKSTITIEVQSTAGVNAYPPVSARVWLDFTISTDKGGKPAALFAGSAISKKGASVDNALRASAAFDYDDYDDANWQDTLLPILKEYPVHASNGIDSVMVKRTKYGARYQSYYFSWNVPPNSMPPLRETKKKEKHPRAWNNYMQELYKYQFTPSRYSEKAHASKAMLIHPEDGAHGTLRHVIFVSPLPIMNGDELAVADQYCDVDGNHKYLIYSYYLVEGISPMTKRPGTSFRPAGLGILKDGNFTLPPIPPDPPPPLPFVVTIEPSYSRIKTGESVNFTSSYSRHSPILHFEWNGSGDHHKGSYSVDQAQFTFKQSGTYTITFMIVNEQGQKGKATATIEVIDLSLIHISEPT